MPGRADTDSYTDAYSWRLWSGAPDQWRIRRKRVAVGWFGHRILLRQSGKLSAWRNGVHLLRREQQQLGPVIPDGDDPVRCMRNDDVLAECDVERDDDDNSIRQVVRRGAQHSRNAPRNAWHIQQPE